MKINPANLSPADRYKLMTGLIVPRPIAWVSSRSADGTANLAPFSYFAIVGHDPMALSVSVTGRKPDGSLKDSACNLMPIERGGNGAFAVNLVSEHQAASMAKTARPLPHDQSEFTFAGLGMVPAHHIDAPMVAGALAAFECRTVAVTAVGSARIFVGEVVHLTVDDDLLDDHRRVDFDRLRAVGRLAGTEYVRTRDRFSLADEGYFPSRAREDLRAVMP